MDSRQILADRIVFGECHKQHSLPNLLTVKPSTMISAYDGKKQTSAKAPVVQINDLAKNHGNQVSVTIIHDLTEKPSMGIDKRDGYEEDVSEGTFEMKINQYHKAVKVPLMMEQQKVGYNRKKLGRPLLTTYHGFLTDEIAMTHLAGARGTDGAVDRILPLATDADFDEIMVNPVTAPTFDRKGYCGAATDIDGTGDGGAGVAIQASDTFDTASVRKFKEQLELMPHPPQKVALGEGLNEGDPLYVGFITPKMWSDYEAGATDFQNQVANALKRTSSWNHPLFKGDMFMKDDILFKKYKKPISWAAGETISVCANDDAATEADQTAPVPVERGIILGAQALAMAYGSVLPGGMGNFLLDGEFFNQKAWWRQWMDWIMGLAKIRFKDNDGRINDYGVFSFDAAVSA
jgi:N4-gp56 family major capsid protein